jgi:hypothetical protein
MLAKLARLEFGTFYKADYFSFLDNGLIIFFRLQSEEGRKDHGHNRRQKSTSIHITGFRGESSFLEGF